MVPIKVLTVLLVYNFRVVSIDLLSLVDEDDSMNFGCSEVVPIRVLTELLIADVLVLSSSLVSF